MHTQTHIFYFLRATNIFCVVFKCFISFHFPPLSVMQNLFKVDSFLTAPNGFGPSHQYLPSYQSPGPQCVPRLLLHLSKPWEKFQTNLISFKSILKAPSLTCMDLLCSWLPTALNDLFIHLSTQSWNNFYWEAIIYQTLPQALGRNSHE